MNSIVIPTKLNTGSNKYKESERAERLAILLLSQNLDLNTETLDITEGFTPEYDLTIENFFNKEITFEVKYTGRNKTILIEYARADENIKSGIQVNESDYTLIISRQTIKEYGKWVYIGKNRLFKTSQLLDWTMKAKDDDNYDKKFYEKSSDGPGSSNVILNPKDHEKELPHLWVGDVRCDDNPISYHMDRFIKSNLNIEQDKLKLDWNF